MCNLRARLFWGAFYKRASEKEVNMTSKTRTQTHFRDSGTGHFISEAKFKKMNPAKVEKEQIKHPTPTKKGR